MSASQLRPKYEGKRRPRSSSSNRASLDAGPSSQATRTPLALRPGDRRGARRARERDEAAGFSGRQTRRQVGGLGHGAILQNDA